MNDTPELVSYLYGFLDILSGVFTLSYIETRKPYRKNKHAVSLIHHVLTYIREYYPEINMIELDDMSDYSGNSVFMTKSLYYRLGFMVQDKNNRWVKWTPHSIIRGPERKAPLKLVLERAMYMLEFKK